MAMTEIWLPSPNYSGRGGTGITKVVLHTTEGAMKIRDLGNYFANPSVQASSHFGADNFEAGVVGAYVTEDMKAWTQGNANPWCLSMELCAYASWSRDTWLNSKSTLVHNAADWVSWMCGKYGIPIKSLSASEAQNTSIKGVCDHVDFGSWGGGHHDCGEGFPMDKVIEWAKSGSSGSSGPTSSKEDDVTAAAVFDPQGQLHQACIGTNNRIYYCPPGSKTYGPVDDGSNAKNGLGIAYNPTNNKIVIIYTNQNGDVCRYEKTKGSSAAWAWIDSGGNAR